MISSLPSVQYAGGDVIIGLIILGGIIMQIVGALRKGANNNRPATGRTSSDFDETPPSAEDELRRFLESLQQGAAPRPSTPPPPPPVTVAPPPIPRKIAKPSRSKLATTTPRIAPATPQPPVPAKPLPFAIQAEPIPAISKPRNINMVAMQDASITKSAQQNDPVRTSQTRTQSLLLTLRKNETLQNAMILKEIMDMPIALRREHPAIR